MDASTVAEPKVLTSPTPPAPSDELLLAGWPAARRALETTLMVNAAREYVLTGRRVPSSWSWRRLTPDARSANQ